MHPYIHTRISQTFSHTRNTKTHTHKCVPLQTGTHIQTYTVIKHTCTHMHLCSFLLTKDQEPGSLDSRGLDCPGETGKPIRNLLSVSGPNVELLCYIPLSATRVSRTLAHTMGVKLAKIIHTTKIFEHLSAAIPTGTHTLFYA